MRFRLSLDCRIRNTALRLFSSAFYSYTIEALLLHLKEPHSDSLRPSGTLRSLPVVHTLLRPVTWWLDASKHNIHVCVDSPGVHG